MSRTYVSLLAAACGALLTYFLSAPAIVPPRYEAEALIYVPLTIPIKQMEQQGIGFASDKEIDGHIQILLSGRLKDSLISRFRLDEELGKDLTQTGNRDFLYSWLEDHLSVEKTRYSSVSIKAWDRRPERAAEMANAVVALGDEIKENLLLENREEAYVFAQELYESKRNEVSTLEQRLDSLVLRADTSLAPVKHLYTKVSASYEQERREMLGRKGHLERERESFGTALPQSYIISEAVAPHQPNWPPRVPLAIGAFVLIWLAFYSLIPWKREAPSS